MFRAVASPLVVVGILAGVPGVASASACAGWTGTLPPNPGSAYDVLNAAAVLSPGNAWAVGSYTNSTNDQDQTLIEHWNGSSWAQVASPDPGVPGRNDLNGVTALSPTNIWAVGSSASETLIVHWNGTSWTQVASPNRGLTGELSDVLTAVRAVSATDIWAVGWYQKYEGAPVHTLVEHWNGTSWALVASPNPDQGKDFLYGIAAISPTSAWAVGDYGGTGTPDRTLVLHWNGTSWRQVASPNPGGAADLLTAVRAVSATNIWAVGYYYHGRAGQTLIEHWNGSSWKQVASPNPGGTSHGNFLNGVAAFSPTNAWAVGFYTSPAKTLVLHWNGSFWKQVASPNPSPTGNLLSGIAASSSANIWAVGHTGYWQTLALHRC